MRIYLAIAIAILLSLAACTNQGITGKVVQEQEEYKIGIILPVSGHFAFYGEKIIQGIKIAEDKIPDLKTDFKIIIEDDEGDIKKAASAANKLIAINQVDALMTARSSISSTVASVAQQQKTPLLYSSTIDEAAKKNSYVFKNFLNIKKDCEELAKMLKGKKGRLLGLSLDSTHNCIEGFKKQGFTLDPQFYDKEEADFRTPLTKIKFAKPDFLVLRASEKSLPLILKQMKELEIKGIQIICPHITGGGCNRPEAIEAYPEYFENALGTDIYITKTDKIKEFDALCEERFKTKPIDLSYSFYESLSIIVPVIKECKGSNECITETLLSSEFEGMDGTISFNKGITERKTNIIEFNGSEWVPIILTSYIP